MDPGTLVANGATVAYVAEAYEPQSSVPGTKARHHNIGLDDTGKRRRVRKQSLNDLRERQTHSAMKRRARRDKFR